jgi:hypothetical protein
MSAVHSLEQRGVTLLAMANVLDLDGVQWDLDSIPTSSSMTAGLERIQAIQLLGPSGLLAVGALGYADTSTDATRLLVDEYGLARVRAASAVRLAHRLNVDGSRGIHPLGYLADVTVTEPQARYITGLVKPIAAATPAPAPSVTQQELLHKWRLGDIQPLVKAAARSGDPAAALAAAALICGNRHRGEFVVLVTEAQFHTLFDRSTKHRRDVSRVLAAAYALSALDRDGLDLGSVRASVGTSPWRMKAAPWVLPILDSENGHAVNQLLEAVHHRGLGFVTPGENPLLYGDDTAVLNDTLAAVTVYADRLTKWSDRPLWFDGGPGEPQILLTQEGSYAYAWVGANGKGCLVAFDTVDLVGYGFDAPGVRAALAHALGWFIDVSISLRQTPSGTSTIRRSSAGSKSAGYRYVPTHVHRDQSHAVAVGTGRTPRPHVVQSHVRRLRKRKPSATARARAPKRIQGLLGPRDTFVRGYVKGTQSVAELDTHLSKYSMLAYVIGKHRTR